MILTYQLFVKSIIFFGSPFKLKFNPQWRVGSKLENSMMGAAISDVIGIGGMFGLEQTTA